MGDKIPFFTTLAFLEEVLLTLYLGKKPSFPFTPYEVMTEGTAKEERIRSLGIARLIHSVGQD